MAIPQIIKSQRLLLGSLLPPSSRRRHLIMPLPRRRPRLLRFKYSSINQMPRRHLHLHWRFKRMKVRGDLPLCWSSLRPSSGPGQRRRHSFPCALGPWERLQDVPLVRGNTMLDPNLDLHLLIGACPPVDRTPIDKSDDTIDNLVRQGLTLYTQVSPLSLIFISFSKYCD